MERGGPWDMWVVIWAEHRVTKQFLTESSCVWQKKKDKNIQLIALKLLIKLSGMAFTYRTKSTVIVDCRLLKEHSPVLKVWENTKS